MQQSVTLIIKIAEATRKKRHNKGSLKEIFDVQITVVKLVK